jgi:hypothetical protein
VYIHIARREVLVDAAKKFSVLSNVTTSNLVGVYRRFREISYLLYRPVVKSELPPKRRYSYQSTRGDRSMHE